MNGEGTTSFPETATLLVSTTEDIKTSGSSCRNCGSDKTCEQRAPWTIRPRQLAPDLQTTGAHMKTPMLRWTYIFLCSYDNSFLKEEET